MKNEYQNQILIIIRGGTIQKIFSSGNVKVEILDYDDEEFESDVIAETEYEKRTSNMMEVL